MGSAMSSKKSAEKVSNPVVNTPLGKAKGFALPKAKCDEAKQVFAFMGLPFATPPLGKLRFEPPQKLKPWKGVLDATKCPREPMQSRASAEPLMPYAPVPLVCDEDIDAMSEDCLYVNVYTNNPNKAAKMPVLFWIYGGAFSMGGTIGYNGQVICGLNDVVLVVPQYRVSAFGFFTTGKDTKWPGNMGLLDQVMALEWTRDNIASFGGDPNNVTIFGESAGAISVSLHVTSPMSRGLFHRAISHSGVGSMPSMVRTDLLDVRKEILTALGITATEPEKIMAELKSLDAKKIIECVGVEEEKRMMLPTVDGKFITKQPDQLLEAGNFSPVPYIIGINNTEGAGLLGLSYTESFATGLDEETATQILHEMFAQELPAEKLDDVLKKTIDFYSKQIDDDKYKWSKVMASISADSFFLVSSVQQALAHSAAGHDTYFYYMTHQLRMHHDDAFSGDVKQKPVFCEADHSDDLTFTFGYPFINGKFTSNGKWSEDERRLSIQWMKSICQFAKTGNPNAIGAVEWPKYDATTQKHLVMKWPYEVGSNLLENRVKFWSETFPSFLE